MLLAWIPLVAGLAGTMATESRAELRSLDQRVVASSATLSPAALPIARRAAPADVGGPPACIGDVCQPRVSVPGYEPRLSIRGKRTELAAHLLDRANLEPLASISHFLVTTGLRLDLTLAALNRNNPTMPSSGAGWGQVQLTLRWRIDALGKPSWARASP